MNQFRIVWAQDLPGQGTAMVVHWNGRWMAGVARIAMIEASISPDQSQMRSEMSFVWSWWRIVDPQQVPTTLEWYRQQVEHDGMGAYLEQSRQKRQERSARIAARKQALLPPPTS